MHSIKITCNSEDETINHLMLRCIYFQALWGLWKEAILISSFVNDNFMSFMKLILEPPISFISNKQQRKQFTTALILNMAAIWRMRNDQVFGQNNPNFSSTLIWLKQVQHELLALHNDELDNMWIDEMGNILRQQQQIKQNHDFITFNIDATFQNQIASIGIIVRDHNGNMEVTLGRILSSNSFGEAEVRTFTLTIGFKNVITESDSANIVNYVNGRVNLTS